MSVLSRAAAPAATHDLAADIATLLTNPDSAAPAELFTEAATEPPAPPDDSSPPSRAAGPTPVRLLGPRGLGAAALRLPVPGDRTTGPTTPYLGPDSVPIGPSESDAGVDEPPAGPPDGNVATSVGPAQGAGPAEARRPSIPSGPAVPVAGRVNGARIPPLYCPPPLRDDPALATAVNEGLLAWAEDIGLYEGRLDELRKADFGRLIMLAHPDCANADQLLAAAKCAVSEWSVDDYYCEEDADDRAPDGTPSSPEAELGPRLELCMAVMDPAHLPARYAPQLERALQADPILRAFRTSFEHLARYATPAQLARLRTEIGGWFIALGAEAGWRGAGRMPPVWEYLANRQPHSFLPCMAPIDTLGGYEVPAAEYTHPAVRRVTTTAALAAQMVNDLYSMAREDLSNGREFNLPTVLAAEEQCSRREAVLHTAAVHDELVHRFEREAAPLAASGSPELRRFLLGLWAWMGGNRAWHADSRRYKDAE
ncbi:family 2 encapsulin nanocompartment cargo protein terpene cyclase [Nocardia lijiangensis]|uniref:family 2 encapsulin nanocompartment cargo protein terpene cyclase n=1 Tax=Nocardia lijiangensis TaxID=299618 RepID=UPI00082B7933|nr:family 2 encapsulin nanocompartment cargo protein terpene cyclase [Nocardia lijiangensis]